VLAEFPAHDLLIMAAAVSDFRPIEHPHRQTFFGARAHARHRRRCRCAAPTASARDRL
jgi:hypothetical protein